MAQTKALFENGVDAFDQCVAGSIFVPHRLRFHLGRSIARSQGRASAGALPVLGYGSDHGPPLFLRFKRVPRQHARRRHRRRGAPCNITERRSGVESAKSQVAERLLEHRADRQQAGGASSRRRAGDNQRREVHLRRRVGCMQCCGLPFGRSDPPTLKRVAPFEGRIPGTTECEAPKGLPRGRGGRREGGGGAAPSPWTRGTPGLE